MGGGARLQVGDGLGCPRGALQPGWPSARVGQDSCRDVQAMSTQGAEGPAASQLAQKHERMGGPAGWSGRVPAASLRPGPGPRRARGPR
jgi:hypothetical protein